MLHTVAQALRTYLIVLWALGALMALVLLYFLWFGTPRAAAVAPYAPVPAHEHGPSGACPTCDSVGSFDPPRAPSAVSWRSSSSWPTYGGVA
jgi:hypothetical protein